MLMSKYIYIYNVCVLGVVCSICSGSVCSVWCSYWRSAFQSGRGKHFIFQQSFHKQRDVYFGLMFFILFWKGYLYNQSKKPI